MGKQKTIISGFPVRVQTLAHIDLRHVVLLDMIGEVDIKMKGVRYTQKDLSELNTNKWSVRDGFCVTDMIFNTLQDQYKFKKLTKNILYQQFDNIRNWREHGISTYDIIYWTKIYGGQNVSVYAFSPFGGPSFKKYILKNKRYSIMYVVNNNHAYPITDENKRKLIAKSDNLVLNTHEFIIDNMVVECFKWEEWGEIIQSESKADILAISGDLSELACHVMTTHETFIEWANFKGGQLVEFKHPITNQLIKKCDDFNMKKNLIKEVFNKYGHYSRLEFKAQGCGEISKLYSILHLGDTPQSEYFEDKSIYSFQLVK